MRAFLIFLYALIILNQGFCQDKIVAIVNNGVITEKEVKDYLNLVMLRLSVEEGDKAEFLDEYEKEKEGALERLIEEKLIIQEAYREGWDIPEEAVDERIYEYIVSFGSRHRFEDSLAAKGLTIASFKEKIKNQLLMRQIINDKVRGRVEITPFEITDYYESHREEFKEPSSVQYRALKFTKQEEAFNVFGQLQGGQSRQEVIDTYRDNLIKGNLKRGQSREELEVLFDLDEGEVSSPINLEEEFYIFIIDRKSPGRILTLEEAKDRAWDMVYQDNFKNVFSEWVNELKEKAVIKKLTDSPEDAADGWGRIRSQPPSTK